MEPGTASLPFAFDDTVEESSPLSPPASGPQRVLPTEAAAAQARRQAPDADILSFTGWTRLLWNDLVLAGLETRILLNPTQEQLLWVSAVDAHPPESTLQSHHVLAAQARLSYARAAGWLALADLPRYAADPAHGPLLRWVRAFERECDTAGALAPARLPEALRKHIRHLQRFPQSLQIERLEKLLPAERELVHSLQAAGWPLSLAPETPRPATSDVVLIPAENQRQEAEAMAAWFAANLIAADGPCSAALVFADAKQSSDFLPALRSRLLPASFTLSSAQFLFSADTSLADEPLIASALCALRLLHGSLSFQQLQSLLLSPYLYSIEQLLNIAKFFTFSYPRLPSLGLEITLEALHARVDAQAPEAVRDMLQRFHAAQALLAGGAPLRTYGQWMDLVQRVLSSLNWSLSTELTSPELTLLDRWQSTLDRIATLDFRAGTVDFPTAFGELERLAVETQATPPPADAPLQVLTPEQAALGGFDALWIAGATQENWPPRPQADPLLPWPLQAAHGMPGTSAAQAADDAQRLSTALLTAAPEVVVSYTRTTTEGEQIPAPLLAGTAGRTISAEALLPLAVEPPATEVLEDVAPPPVTLTGLRQQGGVEIFRAQADCGFRAFAQFRLASSTAEEPTFGLGAGDNGSLLHRTLELFWKQIGDQQHLKELTPEEVDAVADDAVRSALRRYAATAEESWEAAYLNLLQERTRNLLGRWLEHEYDRPTPFRVLAQEDQRELAVGGLNLTIRPDRIDELEDGSLVLIDYKTGSVKPSAWESERPEQPQLPLYAQYFGDRVSAVAYARLRARHGEMSWRGYTSREGILPPRTTDRGNPADLGERIAEWGVTLRQLASEFIAGHAHVSPRDPQITCQFCQQRLLCRVDTLGLASPDEDDEDLGEDPDE